MRLLRVFDTQSQFVAWQDPEPELSKLFLGFSIKPEATKFEPPSIFRVRSEADELECVAGFFQKSGGSPAKLFGVLFTARDCRDVGIRIDGDRTGTGIRRVDDRHANLNGDKEQFRRLVAGIVARIWEGEQRLRIFPANQIAGQVAIFSRLPESHTCEDSRRTCERVLSKTTCHRFHDDESRVEIVGRLKDKAESPVCASRRYGGLTVLGATFPAVRVKEFIKRLFPRRRSPK
jgi:hypothetical protein